MSRVHGADLTHLTPSSRSSPLAASLHNCMLPHGPTRSHDNATQGAEARQAPRTRWPSCSGRAPHLTNLPRSWTRCPGTTPSAGRRWPSSREPNELVAHAPALDHEAVDGVLGDLQPARLPWKALMESSAFLECASFAACSAWCSLVALPGNVSLDGPGRASAPPPAAISRRAPVHDRIVLGASGWPIACRATIAW